MPIFFMIDARVGPTPADHAFAEVARKSGKPIVLIANKSEGTAGEAGGLRPTRSVSASRCHLGRAQ